ncbi:lycopene cyclase family protein [Flavimarina sp. Hel_I_48]|uniref:lycopene cyclase family protein n=1 Tax=Flavimarina sp. Hel_I_48 TaxID=1392488 RepID=UPI0004DF5283|nr:lycopene cyclase family protein [Flavimarina sp. Hel_I_48]
MIKKTAYDYIILGAGLSGLTLALRITEDPFFKDKEILILDRKEKIENDRTWCFWHQGKSRWENIISKKWYKIGFKTTDFDAKIPISPYSYNKITGLDFYTYCFEQLKKNNRISFKTEAFESFEETAAGVRVHTKAQTYTSKKLFNSILPPEVLKKQHNDIILNQHFIGWFITTSKPVFDPETAVFMDFSIPQEGNTRFMYVMPTSPTEALVEYTLFSEKLLPDETYENGIKNYLEQHKIDHYTITEKEQGCIPMTVFTFEKRNSKHVINIGTAGGWTRASTGFTFTYTQKRTEELVAFLKQENDLRKFKINDRYRWYDRIFLDVLYRKNEQGSRIFEAMFKNNPTDRIFRFLDGESSIAEDFKIIWSLPKKEFIKSVLGLK